MARKSAYFDEAQQQCLISSLQSKKDNNGFTAGEDWFYTSSEKCKGEKPLKLLLKLVREAREETDSFE